MTLTNFTDEISPFPATGNFHRSSGFQPPQKLRPIRNNAPDSSETVPPDNFSSPPEHVLAFNAPHVLVLQQQQQKQKQKQKKELCDSPSASAAVDTSGGTRWPLQETRALLAIRLEMDVQFRGSNPRGISLWETISRKLGELGYSRDAKKCREKFENVYKYYRRTKGRLNDGGRIYKFFCELEALENQKKENLLMSGGKMMEVFSPMPENCVSENGTLVATPQSSSSEYSYLFNSDDGRFGEYGDENVGEKRKEKGNEKLSKKFEKMRPYMESLVEKVMKKQEEMHTKVLELIEKKEKERARREEAWRKQEIEREKREKEMRAQEEIRSVALMSFLGKALNEQVSAPVPVSFQQFQEGIVCRQEEQGEKSALQVYKPYSGSKRWPKCEIQALIAIRTVVLKKYRNAPSRKPVWEEISLEMASMGYDRNAKKCKEKWDNINKYFKRALGSGKQRPENAKTCPYFHELSVLYQNGTLDLVTSPGGMTTSPGGMTSEGDGVSMEQISDSAGACTLFSMSQALKPDEIQSGSTPASSNGIHPSNL